MKCGPCTLQCGFGLHYSVNLPIQTYTEPIAVKVLKTRHKISVDIRIFLQCGRSRQSSRAVRNALVYCVHCHKCNQTSHRTMSKFGTWRLLNPKAINTKFIVFGNYVYDFINDANIIAPTPVLALLRLCGLRNSSAILATHKILIDIDKLLNFLSVITDRVRREGKAIGSVRLSVCLSVCPTDLGTLVL